VVPTGTNGGVSILGLIMSFIAGALIGFVFYIGGILFVNATHPFPSQLPCILIGAFSGLIGSVIDSILGATLQLSLLDKKTGKITSVKTGANEYEHISGIDVFDNHQVNFVSALITSILVGFIGQYYF